MDADVIVVGGGLAGLVACAELTAAGHRVVLVEQENAANLGGQAFWSFGGLFLVDTPEQRRWGIRDSAELAWQDWQGSAQWDRLGDEDRWGARWGEAYVAFAAGEKRAWLRQQGVRLTPLVGWAERGDGRAGGHGNSVPRFHLPWGTGTGVSGPFAAKARAAAAAGLLELRFRHRVDGLVVDGGAVTGVRGAVLAHDEAPRGVASNRDEVGEFALTARAVVLTTGGIGANHDLVRRLWPARLGTPPRRMLTGVPAHVDGRMLGIAEDAGASVVNKDRMWHYTEGVANWDPIWAGHGIRILPGPSSMWFDALGRRLPAPGIPGHDTLGTLRLLRTDPGIAGLRPLLVRRLAADRGEGVRALRLRAEPRPHEPRLAAAAPHAPGSRPDPARRGVRAARARLRRRGRPVLARGRDEPDRAGGAPRPRADRAADPGARRRGREPVHEGRAAAEHPQRPTGAQRPVHPRRRRRTASSTRPPVRSSR